MQHAWFSTLAAMAFAHAAFAQIDGLRAGQMLPVDAPAGETMQRLTGPGPFFVYGLEADDGITRQRVSFLIAPMDDAAGEVDVQFVSFNRDIVVDPDGNIDAPGKGSVMILDFEKTDSEDWLAALEEEQAQEEEPEMTRHPVIYWPWWLVDYEDGSVGAEGTRILCVFGFTSKYTNGKRMIVVLLEDGPATVQHPLLPDGYLEIDKKGRGYELEWGKDADGNDRLSVNGDEVDPDDRFRPKRWSDLGLPGMHPRVVEVLQEYHAIRKSPSAKP